MPNGLIFAVDDESNIRELLSYNLVKAGYIVESFETGEQLLTALKLRKPDVIILDIMLNGMQGTEILRIIRSDSLISYIPVIMLTAKGEEFEKVAGLESGADDYLTKPFSVNELIARIRAITRRIGKIENENASRIIIDNLILDSDSREVIQNGRQIKLTHKEFELLSLLMQNKNKVYTRDDLLNKIWGYEYYGNTRTVDVHVRQLRKHLNDDEEYYIKTIRGVGYKFRD